MAVQEEAASAYITRIGSCTVGNNFWNEFESLWRALFDRVPDNLKRSGSFSIADKHFNISLNPDPGTNLEIDVSENGIRFISGLGPTLSSVTYSIDSLLRNSDEKVRWALSVIPYSDNQVLAVSIAKDKDGSSATIPEDELKHHMSRTVPYFFCIDSTVQPIHNKEGYGSSAAIVFPATVLSYMDYGWWLGVRQIDSSHDSELKGFLSLGDVRMIERYKFSINTEDRRNWTDGYGYNPLIFTGDTAFYLDYDKKHECTEIGQRTSSLSATTLLVPGWSPASQCLAKQTMFSQIDTIRNADRKSSDFHPGPEVIRVGSSDFVHSGSAYIKVDVPTD